MHSEAEFLFWEICFPFITNNKNLGKRVKNQNHNVQYTGTQQIYLYFFIFFLSLADLGFILNKLPFQRHEAPTMLLEKVSIHTESSFVHIYDYFPNFSNKKYFSSL
jgi:hypothetical protein